MHPIDPPPSRGTCRPRRTLGGRAQIVGIGFVTGADVRVTLLPAAAGTGRVFVRTDLLGRPRIPARTEYLVERQRRTALAVGPVAVEMTEHLLAALAASQVDDVVIEIDAGEAPGLDGSAMGFVKAIDAVGTRDSENEIETVPIPRSMRVEQGAAVLEAHPPTAGTTGLTIEYHLEYDHPGIGTQFHSHCVSPTAFRAEIASARTFVLESEIAALKRMGLGPRSTAQDLLVFSDSDGKPIDNDLRFPNECVRHKILDVIGDLALVGVPIAGHVKAWRSGHAANTELATRLAAEIGSSLPRPSEGAA